MNNKDEAYKALNDRLPLHIPRYQVAKFLEQLPSEWMLGMDESRLEHMFWKWYAKEVVK